MKIKPLITECIMCGGRAEYVHETQEEWTGRQDVFEETEIIGWRCMDEVCGHFREEIQEVDGDVQLDDNL